MPDANPINPTYTFQNAYHQNPAKYNRTYLATAGFIATGSYANSVAFYQSGSAAATVTLVNGGTINIAAAAASTPASIFEMGVATVVAGSVYLLYNS